jgi:hypothetical protein
LEREKQLRLGERNPERTLLVSAALSTLGLNGG